MVSRFWDLCQVFEKSTDAEAATAEHLFNLVQTSFKKYDISFENIIGFASDGCNTMMGSSNSVASRFRILCPGISIFKCICHSLHLCASEACKILPRSCEDLTRNIYNEFKNSAKRQYQFQEFQQFFDLKIHKILRPSQTRWLSLGAIVTRIVEQWEALQLYFKGQLSTARLHSVEQIIQALENSLIKLYFLFLEWVLPKFNKLNEFFQSDSVVLTTVYDKMSATYQELLEAYMQNSYVKNTSLSKIDPFNVEKRLLPEQMYFGVKVMTFLSTPEIRNNLALNIDFKIVCAKFLAVGCSEIKKRFDFDNQILKDLTNLNPSKAVLRKTRETMPSLLPLMKTVPRIVSPKQYQSIDDEWRTLPLFELPSDINIKDNVHVFWAKLGRVNEGDQGLTFKHLSKFCLYVISLPHSNAECERIFSKVNQIKTKSRNKMITETMNGLILAKQRVKNCVQYEPSKNEYSYMTKSVLYPNKKPNEDNNKSKKFIGDLYEMFVILTK